MTAYQPQGHYSTKLGPRHGQLNADVWTKAAQASRHMLKTPRAWALDLADIEAAEGRGAHLVHIHDLEQQRHYWAAIEVVWRLGFRFDRGFGEQLALALDQWRSTRSEAEALAEALREPEPVAVQLGLFEVVR